MINKRKAARLQCLFGFHIRKPFIYYDENFFGPTGSYFGVGYRCKYCKDVSGPQPGRRFSSKKDAKRWLKRNE